MRHFSLEEWADFSRGVVEGEQRTEMHIDTALAEIAGLRTVVCASAILAASVRAHPPVMKTAPCEHHPICSGNPLKPALPSSDQEEDQEMALTQWQVHIGRLRLLVEQADEFTPSAFVKRVDEFMPELRSAAMGTVIHV